MGENDVEKMQQADHDTLIRLESKVDTLVETIKSLEGKFTYTFNDYGNRLAKLEMWQHDFGVGWKLIVGGATVFGVVIGWVMQLLTGALHK